MNLELKKIISQLWSTCKYTFPTINDTESSTSTVYSSNKTESSINNALAEPKQNINTINEELEGIRYLIIGNAEEVEV